MKRFAYLTMMMIACFAVSVVAGEKREKCTADTQTCLNKIASKGDVKGWLGVELEYGENGALVITKIIPDSPAAKANLKAGESLVAMNGFKYGSHDKAAKKAAYAKAGPGDTVVYTLASARGKERKQKITLAKIPEDVIAKWAGNHLVKHHVQRTDVN